MIAEHRTAPLSDDQITDWREAVLVGGLPAPTRADRWQVLRAGVVNLWEFEDAEYWYADGWVQLTGRNETGKSSLMALTTLIPWLGDTSTSNIDTLGGSGKQFRYYVEPSSLDGDRRDASSSSSRGWLWVEYARLTSEGGAEFFTTLGYAETRRASATLTPRWCTVRGLLRVRSGLDLAVARAVRSPKELREAIGETTDHVVLPHDSATAYRSAVATQLLGAEVGQLEAVGKMLRIARTPKLGESLNAHFVTEKLRDALPGLERSEVEALAEGWEQLDRARRDLALAKSNREALRDFSSRAWVPYSRARLRRGADSAARARSAFDQITRAVREATAVLEAAHAKVTRVSEAADVERRAAELARSQHEALRDSPAHTEAKARAHNLRHAEEQLGAARQRIAQAKAARAERSGHFDRASDAVAVADDGVRGRASDLAASVDQLRHHLSAAGLSAALGHLDQHDWPRVERALTGRSGALEHLTTLDRAADRVEQRAHSAEEVAASKRSDATDARSAAEAAWTQAEHTREHLGTAVAQWAGSLPGPVRPTPQTVDGWLESLARQATDTTRLADQVRVDWLTSHQDVEVARRLAAQAHLGELADQVAAIDSEIARLREEHVPVPPDPALWRRSPRGQGPAVPFWALVDPRPDVDSQVLARVEAALAAIGLLDALVSPDGLVGPEGDVIFDSLVAPEGPVAEGPTLGDLLEVNSADPRLALVASAALARIALSSLPDLVDSSAGYAVAADGSWRTPMLLGRALPLHDSAELIGEAARAAARARRLMALADDRDHLADATRIQEVRLREAEGAWEALATAYGRLPADDRLIRQLAAAGAHDGSAERLEGQASRAEAEALQRRREADEARSTLLDYARSQRLPVVADELAVVREALHLAGKVLPESRQMHLRLADANTVREQAEQRLTEAAGALERAGDDERRADTAFGLAATTVQSLRDSINDDDAAILARVRELEAAEKAHLDTARAFDQQIREALEAQGRAEQRRDQAQHDRALRQGERDAAFAEFWRLVDAGLADEALIPVEGRDQRSVEATRDQVAVIRERIPDPRGWAADAATQADVERRLLQRVTERLDGLRANLEEGGRTTRLDQSCDPATVEIVLEATGTAYGPRSALERLEAIEASLAAAYDESVQSTLTELLGSAFIEHLRDRLVELRRLTARINRVLSDHPTGTTRTRLRIHLAPAAGATEGVIAALESGDAILDAAIAQRVRDFLKNRIEGARSAAVSGAGEWPQVLAHALDYRHWFAVTLQKRTGDAGHWTPLTAQNYAHLSGGARVVMLMLPFVATLTALYESMPSAPRPFWLDEAFDGLDTANRATVLALLDTFDLDVLVVGPGRLLNSPSVPVAAIYQVVRAEDPLPGADLAVELWAGGELRPLDPRGASVDLLTVRDDGTTTLFGSWES